MYKFLIQQIYHAIQLKNTIDYNEKFISKLRYIPKSIFVLIAPSAFLILSLVAFILAGLDFNLSSAKFYVLLSASGLIFFLVAIIINYSYEFIVKKKVNEIQRYKDPLQKWRDIREIFSPVTDQLKKEKDHFISLHLNGKKALSRDSKKSQIIH